MEKKLTVKKTKVLSIEEFNKLPKATQRIMIAKDVIAQIAAGRYRPMRSVYIKAKKPKGVLENDGARENLDKIQTCTVCAMGACIVSAVRFKNKVTVGQLLEPYKNKDNMKSILSVFPANQWVAIESAFEGMYNTWGFWSTVDIGGKLTEKQRDAALSFSKKQSGRTDTLVAIMQNIIDNQGTFKP